MSKSTDPKLWLQRAKSVLEISKVPKQDCYFYEDLCHLTQQSAEKSIKALMFYEGLIPERIHNLRQLLEELEKRVQIPKSIYEVIKLNVYAVVLKYPDDFVEVTEEEYKKAVELAERVYNWVKESIK